MVIKKANKTIDFTLALVITAVFSIFAFNLVIAEVDFEKVSFVKSYGPGSFIEGVFKLKLNDEPADSKITAVLTKSGGGDGDANKTTQVISLLDFLRKNNKSFACSPSDCEPVYLTSNPGNAKSLDTSSFQLTEEQFAFVIEKGNFTEIRALSFNISGNSETQSQGIIPVAIDLLDDGTIDWRYMESGAEDSPLGSPAYNSSAAEWYDPGEEYCEKIEVFPSKKFKLGADLQVIGPDQNAIISMSISDLDTGDTGSCEIITNKSGFLECVVDEIIISDKKDIYVCFSSTNAKLKGETQDPNCGHVGLESYECPGSESTVDYAIYARPFKFKGFNETLTFDADTFSDFTGGDLLEYAQDYIDKEYRSNCPAGGCVIPLKVMSRADLTLSQLVMQHYSPNYGVKTSRSIYLSSRNSSVIDMNQSEVKISKAEFKTPISYGKYDFDLTLGTEKLEDTTIEVERVPLIESVSPLNAFAAIETRFSAYVRSPKNNTIVSYEWDFGDGNFKETTEPFATNNYPLGVFILSLKVTDDDGLTAVKSFEVITQEPKDAVNSTLSLKRRNLENFKTSLLTIPSWYADIISSAIDVKSIEDSLSSIESEYSFPGADYVSLKLELDKLVAPSNVSDEEIGSSLIVSVVDVNYLKKLGENVEEGKEEQTKLEVERWIAGNADMRIRGSVKVAKADTKPEDDINLATSIRITLNSKNPGNYSADKVFLVIKLPAGVSFEEVRFAEDLDAQDMDGAMIITLDGIKGKTIDFALPGRHDDLTSLDVFASPTLNKLEFDVIPEVYCGNLICEEELGEDYNLCPEDCEKPKERALVLIAFILAGLVGGLYVIWTAYAIWYDNKQRAKLFGDKKDFYNLSFFIANEINKGNKESKIKETLEKAGWNSDQVIYGLKKVRQQTKKVHRESVLNFILGEMEKGSQEDEIRKLLKKAGWKSSLINWGFRKAKKMNVGAKGQ